MRLTRSNCLGWTAQTDVNYLAYRVRACFTNATRRAADEFVVLVFPEASFEKIIQPSSEGFVFFDGSR